MADASNDWAGERARRWASVADALEAQIAPVDEVLLDAAALAPGERVLDVGCGRGATTRRVAGLVGTEGRVVAVDVSEELVGHARVQAHEGAPIEYRVADAQGAPLADLAVDAVVSRFGVMFFADPVAAFANLRSAARPGGRLAVAVWQRRDRSSLMERPISVARRVAEAAGVTLALPPPDGGPFSLGDEDEARRILTSAGWSEVAYLPHRLPMHAGGPGTVEHAVDTALSLGALNEALAGAPAELVAEVRRALEADLATVHDGTGVALEGAVAVLTARSD